MVCWRMLRIIKMSCICQILEKNCEYSETVCHLFKDFKEAYDTDKHKVLYNFP
jgi:hypothetical protein